MHQLNLNELEVVRVQGGVHWIRRVKHQFCDDEGRNRVPKRLDRRRTPKRRHVAVVELHAKVELTLTGDVRRARERDADVRSRVVVVHLRAYIGVDEGNVR